MEDGGDGGVSVRMKIRMAGGKLARGSDVVGPELSRVIP
jgi:hypothetical protein